MGTYADTDDVASEFKGITFSATSRVTTTEVGNFIDEAEARIEAKLGMIYSIPITGTKSLLIMKTLVVQSVKARILDILYVKTGNPEADQGGSGSASLYKEVKETIADLVSKKMLLIDASLLSGKGWASYQNDNDIDPVFTKDTVERNTPSQW